MGMDQYFTVGAPWPSNGDTFCELRNHRALNRAIGRHGVNREFSLLLGDLKGSQITDQVIDAIRGEMSSGTIWDASFQRSFYDYEFAEGKASTMSSALDQCEAAIKGGHQVYYRVCE